MNVNKIIYGYDTLIDLTSDTITPDTLRSGFSAHKSNGEIIIGTLKSAALLPYIEELNCGWVGPGNGLWTYENPTKTFADVYQVRNGHSYFLTFGANVGTRARVMFTTEDVSKATGNVTGSPVNPKGYDNPSPYYNLTYAPDEDGYIIIAKDNVGKSGIKTYLYDMTEAWL